MKKILCCLSALLLLSACVPTPEQEFVVSHTQPQAASTSAATSSEQPADFSYPTRWEETMDIGITKVIFEADVLTSPDRMHPVLRVERGSFDGQTCRTIIEAAFGTCEWRENELSREEILKIIDNIRLGLVDGYDEATQQFIRTPLEDEEELLAPYIQQLQEAPTEDRFVTLTSDLLSSKDIRNRALRTEDGSTLYFRKTDYEGLKTFYLHKYFNGMIQPENWVLLGDAMIDEPPHALNNIKISEEEAIAAADAFIQRTGRDDLRFSYSEKARLFKELDSLSAGRTQDNIAEGYWLHYAQSTTGYVPNGYYLRNAETFLGYENLDIEYGQYWDQELLDIFVTEEGILSVTWRNPMNVAGVEIGDVQLLPYEQAQARIRTMLEYGVKGSKKLHGNTGNVYVEQVMLSAYLRPIQDDRAHALLTPVWIVRFTTDDSRRWYTDPYFLVIDATDGSLVL